jgi:two-component system, chemotaxis family, chemotaxis protein CheY
MTSSHTILVVEDDHDVRDAFVQVLQSDGYEAVPACDGEEALTQLQGGLAPCLILLDLMMPRMNGWEFIEHHGRLESRSPIIVVSAYGSPEQLGSQDVIAYMRKPVDIEALLELIARHCRKQ